MWREVSQVEKPWLLRFGLPPTQKCQRSLRLHLDAKAAILEEMGCIRERLALQIV